MPKSLNIAGAFLALGVLSWIPLAAWSATPAYEARVDRVLAGTPLIDGHNDLPWEIRSRFKGDLAAVDLKSDTARLPFPPDSAALSLLRKPAWERTSRTRSSLESKWA